MTGSDTHAPPSHSLDQCTSAPASTALHTDHRPSISSRSCSRSSLRSTPAITLGRTCRKSLRTSPHTVPTLFAFITPFALRTLMWSAELISVACASNTFAFRTEIDAPVSAIKRMTAAYPAGTLRPVLVTGRISSTLVVNQDASTCSSAGSSSRGRGGALDL